MQTELSTAAFLMAVLLTAGALAQGLPRGPGGGPSGDEPSPSLSRARTPARSAPGQAREDRERSRARPARPVEPPAAQAPSAATPSPRPGVGTLPSGDKRADPGQPGGFLELPASGAGSAARAAATPVKTPAVPRPAAPKKPAAQPARRPAPPAASAPQAYRSRWELETPFTPGWYRTRAPAAPPHRTARYHPWFAGRQDYKRNHWWAWTTLTALTQWIINQWAQPVFYGYGTGGNVVYQDRFVYVDGVLHATAEDYYRQARAIALSVPDLSESDAARLEWLPLGVFAVTRQAVSRTHTYLQLAVTREGILGGTTFNEATGVVRPVEGRMDRDTQRAAWMFADGKNTDFVVETSFYSLARDRVPVLVHFGPDRTEVGLLVRTEEPAED
ncbi:MAG: hypothetical protein JXQ29_01065 [Planctomycetes bacterium]|nr:hypothetical protein [Planctomycetota bacterium]